MIYTTNNIYAVSMWGGLCRIYVRSEETHAPFMWGVRRVMQHLYEEYICTIYMWRVRRVMQHLYEVLMHVIHTVIDFLYMCNWFLYLIVRNTLYCGVAVWRYTYSYCLSKFDCFFLWVLIETLCPCCIQYSMCITWSSFSFCYLRNIIIQ